MNRKTSGQQEKSPADRTSADTRTYSYKNAQTADAQTHSPSSRTDNPQIHSMIKSKTTVSRQIRSEKKDRDPRTVYADIIDLPPHRSESRPAMSLHDRAAQFAPFAALTGFDDMIREESRQTDPRPELSESELENLNRKLQQIDGKIRKGLTPEVFIEYFVPDPFRTGGSFRSVTGGIRKIDPLLEQLTVFRKDERPSEIIIDFQYLLNLEIEEQE